MAGIYVHIPFCRKACTYCDFHFSTNLQRKGDLAQAIAAEARLQKNYFPEGTVLDTLYFGGGTPSLLLAAEWETILSEIHSHFAFSEGFEFTVECNPDDLDREQLQLLRELGVNRLSIGVQSFRDQDLRLMNRSHDARQARGSILLARKMGFENITADLIYGIPGLSDKDWKKNVQALGELEVPHISAYALTVEEKTLLQKQVDKGSVKMPEDDAFERQYITMIQMLEHRGFEHYELSNFAKEGFRSRHNSSYWSGEAYLGLGPSAHSFKGNTRTWNVASNANYLKMLGENALAIEESEELTKTDEANEYLLTRLRLREGIQLEVFKDKFGWDVRKENIEMIDFYEAADYLEQENGWIRLTPKGLLLSNSIISELFVD